MLVPIRWLKDYVDIDMGAHELAELLTMTGTKVEAVTITAENVRGIISARVESIEAHPGDPRLKVANLTTPQYRFKVVTAANNVSAGDIVPLATPGAVLADGKEIGIADFGGISSEGMMCSSMELGISDEADGILLLSDSCLTGLDLVSVLNLQDEVLELEITPNRPDCLGIFGVAREVSAITGLPLRWPEVAYQKKGEHISAFAQAAILDPEYCSRYALKLFSDVKVAPSPLWMQVRLRAAGIRPISNIVDVTNYVMIDVNQPLHAFDYDRIEGGRISVRRSAAGEAITTLDGQSRPVEEGMLLICDAVKPVAVAGVMGGAESEIGPDTHRVLLESANFLRQSVWRTSKTLKLRTESSSRFEKGLDPETVPLALRRSASLLTQMGAASVNPGTIDVNFSARQVRTITTSRGWISGKIGTDLGHRADEYLSRLGLSVEAEDQSDAVVVSVPSWRADITEPIDLVEEVARIHGFDRLDSRVPANSKPSAWTEEQIAEKKIKAALTAIGMHEAMTYSMVPRDEAAGMRLSPDERAAKPIMVMNPLSEDQVAMRTMLLPSLLRVASTNHRRGAAGVRMFEVARTYLAPEGGLGDSELPRGAKPAEEGKVLSGVISGYASAGGMEKSWYAKERRADFYDAKGALESLLHALGIEDWEIMASEAPYLRPGRAADLYVGGYFAGSFGQLHPDTAEHFEVPEDTVGFEVALEPVLAMIRKDMRFKGIPKYPPSTRDVAMIANRKITSDDIRGAIIEAAGKYLESVGVFDVYEGAGVPKGSRSLAFTLRYRALERTLTTEEVNAVHDAVRSRLGSMEGVTLR